jgi:hypothetical protein
MMTQHPYKNAPPQSFWSRSVAAELDPSSVPDGLSFQVSMDDRIMSAGSCFASNVRRYLEAADYNYTVTERTHPMWPEGAEEPYYEAFSARYGNIYTARQMAQLLDRALGTFRPTEEYWLSDGAFIDPFRPGLRHRSTSTAEFRALTKQHLRAVLEAVTSSSVFVFTLGLTEAWVSREDGAVFPACPGTVAGEFDPHRHKFHNFSVDEVTADLVKMIDLARSVNESLKIVLTISPVPLVATASAHHVLVATTYSKSVLRVAADQASRLRPGVGYFPAYELVLGPHHRESVFEADLRTVKEPVIAEVMDAFFATVCAPRSDQSRSAGSGALPDSSGEILERALAASITADCEEMMTDDQLVGRTLESASGVAVGPAVRTTHPTTAAGPWSLTASLKK